MKLKITLLAVTAVVALVATSASIAGVSTQTSTAPEIAPRAALADVGSLEVFSRPSSFDSTEANSFRQLKNELRGYPADITAGQIQLASARPFQIPSGDGTIWIAKSADGGICVFTPQLTPGSAAGFSSACSSLSDFNRVGLTSLTAGDDDDFVAVSVQPSDVADPVVTSTDGDSRTVPVDSDVAVANLEQGEAVSAGGMTLSTNDIN